MIHANVSFLSGVRFFQRSSVSRCSTYSGQVAFILSNMSYSPVMNCSGCAIANSQPALTHSYGFAMSSELHASLFEALK